MKKNTWASQFGAKRRASDRKLLADLERQIAAEEADVEKEARKIAAQKMGLIKDVNGERLPDELWKQTEKEAQERIARAFGRPVIQ